MYLFLVLQRDFLDKINSETEYNFKMNSSDVSQIEGIVITSEELNDLNNRYTELNDATKCLVLIIPSKYQNNIKDFITDYWDGEFIFDK